MTWADNRARFAAEDLLNHHDGHGIYQRTGTPIHAMSPLSKLWWLKQDENELLKRQHAMSILNHMFCTN